VKPCLEQAAQRFLRVPISDDFLTARTQIIEREENFDVSCWENSSQCLAAFEGTLNSVDAASARCRKLKRGR